MLDAVAFALYGTVPGARTVKRLRCDTADPQTCTEVVLELTVQDRRLRLTRRPEYRRPKRRGPGETTQHAKATLSWIGSAAAERGPGMTRIDEVNRTVERLVGMNAEQFFRVVLLPQGQFAEFLRAETAEREQLLEKLFGTERFAAVEKWFRDRRQNARAEIQVRGQILRDLTVTLGHVIGTSLDGDTWPEEFDTHQLDRAHDLVSADHARAEAARIAAEAHAATTRARVEQENALADRLTRLRRAHEELGRLHTDRDVHRQWQIELDAARRACHVRPGVRELTAARAERDNARLAEHTLRADHARDTTELPTTHTLPVDRSVEELRCLWRTLCDESASLSELVLDERRQHDDHRRRAALTDRLAASAAEESEVLAVRTRLPAVIIEARSRLAAATEAAVRVERLKPRHDELVRALSDAARLEHARAERDRLREAAESSVDTHQRARDTLLELRERRLAGMAAELASALGSDAACPVCGSTEHPAPANPSPRGVSEVDEATAVEVETQCHRARTAAARRFHEGDSYLNSVVARLEGFDLALLPAERDEVAEELRRAESAAAEITAATAALDAASIDESSVADRLAELGRTVAELTATRTELDAGLRERAARLDDARQDFVDVAARRDHLDTLARSVERLIQAGQAVAQAERRVALAETALTELAVEAGFPDVESTAAALRDPEVVETLEARLTEVQARISTARATLADPDLFGLDPDRSVDLPAAKEADERARRALAEAVGACRTQTDRRADFDRLAERLRAERESFAPVEAEFAELDALTDVINGLGQNARRMSLRSYVLAARLEEVAIAASARLRRMSQGRYTFVHNDAHGPRGTRGGLGLDILDDYSGLTRPTRTLSGGESFLASLALALGLSDVVAAETGGARLDTLFVDEGFGSLDADTLDMVMDTLDDLRAGGRVVGLVSHVDELRQRIPVRLRVRKSRTGSTLELTA